MIENQVMDEAFQFYDIDVKYKEKCYKCAKEISINDNFAQAFNRVYKTLYYSDFSVVKKYGI